MNILNRIKQSEPVEQPVSDGKKHVHNLIILDESGSMELIYRPALSGLNETLQTIRCAQEDHPDQAHFVTLVAFSSARINRIYANTPAEEAADVTAEDYSPKGATPLYDAMGQALTELRKQVNKDDVVLVTIITDGYENASREYHATTIKRLVEFLKGRGWVFTYIGANQNVEAVAASMSIDNHLAFEADDEGAADMFAKDCCARKAFFGKVAAGFSMGDMACGFFDVIDREKKDKFD